MPSARLCDYCRAMLPTSLLAQIEHMQQHVAEGLCQAHRGQFVATTEGELMQRIVATLRRYERSAKLGLDVPASNVAGDVRQILILIESVFLHREAETNGSGDVP